MIKYETQLTLSFLFKITQNRWNSSQSFLNMLNSIGGVTRLTSLFLFNTFTANYEYTQPRGSFFQPK